MFRKPLFWIVFCLLSILALLFTVRYLPTAMSMLQVDITMSRGGSLRAADSLHTHLGIELDDYRQTTSFTSDSHFQNYIELKAGGKKVLTKILESGEYKPYYWYIRHFKEGETREFRSYFTPEGELYGFHEKVPENEEGPALNRDAAIAIAKTSAKEQWYIDPARYTLIESAQNEQPNGRIDHTFTFEMNDDEIAVDIGEANYRLIITISGDRLTSLRHTTRVPESFSNEFQEMYSFNMTLTIVAMGLMVLIYGTVMIIWLVNYLKQRMLLFKPSLKWALVVGIFSLISGLSYFSFYWLSYDTSTSANNYFLQQILYLLMGTIFTSVIIFLILAIAEALTRQAFPQQIQFWKLMDKDVASSKTVLGYVIGAYLLVPMNLAFIAAFYLFATTRLGWWIPSGIYENPNVLGALLPSVSAINIGIYAGIMEEALFRAVPLATLAIVGTKLNKRTLFLTIGIIVQIFIFSASHASYPQQPYYFRLVELIIPSLMFAFLYLRLNLVMAILVHFAFNASLGGLSFFTMQAPGLWFDRVLFVLLFFLPLFFVLFRRWQAGDWRSDRKSSFINSIYRFLFVNWREVPKNKLNASFQEELSNVVQATGQDETEMDIKDQSADTGNRTETDKPDKNKRYLTVMKAAPLAIIIYLAGWFILTNYDRPGDIPQPRLEIRAQEAVELADQALTEWLGSDIPDEFSPYPNIFQIPKRVRHFVINKNGKDAYSDLKDKYLFEDAWRVNYKRFAGDLVERTEQFNVYLTSDGEVFNIYHRIAEDLEGPQLSEDEARELTMKALRALPDYDQMGIREVSVTPRERPHRMDWTFTYTDTLNLALEIGEPRIWVSITGDNISSVSRSVFIPEESEREISSQLLQADTFDTIAFIILALLLLSGIIIGVIKTARKELDIPSFKWIFLTIFVFSILYILINWQFTIGMFSTISPYSNQLTMSLIGVAMQAIFISGFFALFFSFNRHWQKTRPAQPLKKAEKWLLYAAGLALLALIIPSTREAVYIGNILHIPQFNTVLSSNQTLSLLINSTRTFLLQFGLVSYIFYIVEKMSRKGKIFSALAWLIMVLFAFSLAFQSKLPYYSEPYISAAWLTGIAYSLLLYLAYQVLTKIKGDHWIAGFLVFFSIDIFKRASMNGFVGAATAYLLSFVLMAAILLIINKVTKSVPDDQQ